MCITCGGTRVVQRAEQRQSFLLHEQASVKQVQQTWAGMRCRDLSGPCSSFLSMSAVHLQLCFLTSQAMDLRAYSRKGFH